MARMAPALDEQSLREVRSHAEQEVYRSLRDKLPDRYLVVHSLQLVGTTPRGTHVDMESDFTIFDPQRGFIVIEVKGGEIQVDGPSRRWYSVDRHRARHEIKIPLTQASRNKHEVLKHVRGSPLWGESGAPRILACHSALFPDCSSIDRLVGPERPRELLGANEALQHPEKWIDGVFSFWANNDSAWSSLGERGMEVVNTLFCASIRVKASLALEIEREARRQIELTDRQARVLRSLRQHHRCAVAGGAGTGKTVLALRHASELAALGIRTLLVCYNRALADFIKRQIPNHEKNLHAMSFHQLCDWRIKCVLAEHGIDLAKEASEEYPGRERLYEVQMPYALARSTEIDPFRYQAIVVDEGQDFGDEFWMPIEMLLEDRQDSHLYIFHDPNQEIYGRSQAFPISDPPLLLPENCRNTRHIHEAAYAHYSGPEVDPPDIEGEPPVLVSAPDVKGQAKLVRKIVSELIFEDKVRPEDIAVLVMPDHKDAHFRALDDQPAPTGSKWSFEKLWVPGAVLVDTARRFKGLEAPVVILWGMDRVNSLRDRGLIYMSLSRARSRLWIVNVG